MLRRIVQLRTASSLVAGWQQRSFQPTGTVLDRELRVSGMGLQEARYPTPNLNKVGVWSMGPATMMRSRNRNAQPPASYNIVAEFEDREAIARLKYDRRDQVVEVYADLPIEPTAVYPGAAAVGTQANVSQLMGTARLGPLGLTGKGVRVVIVDTGVDATFVPVDSRGWAPPGVVYQPGSGSAHDKTLGHATMCAHDVRLIAPQATLHDFALLRSTGVGLGAFLSDALTAFAEIADLLEGDWAGQPVVINNSWGVYNRSGDEPPGTPGNYSSNLNHVVNQQIGALAALGADVLFAAGNCGLPGPDVRCGIADQGPGKSIHGANSHPDVITVSAVTVDNRRLAYSSQGPGTISTRKPDVAAYSHFAAESAWTLHSGTSAACPVLAGAIAALRTKAPGRTLSTTALKTCLQRSAQDPTGTPGWDADLGHGVVDVMGALALMSGGTPAGAGAPRPKRATPRKKSRKAAAKKHRAPGKRAKARRKRPAR